MLKYPLLFLMFGLLIMSGISLNAQSFKADYTYDANGNRKTASVTYISLKSAKLDSGIEKLVQTDSISNFTIKLYPNPTHDIVNIEIQGVTFEHFALKSNSINIWDMQGKDVMEIPVSNINNSADLSTLANGSYFIRITVNGKVESYKIIKN